MVRLPCYNSPTFLTPMSTLSFLFQKSTKISARRVGSSYKDVYQWSVPDIVAETRTSCSICPTLGTTTCWNLPCIWPIMSSLSRRSVPAKMRTRAVLAAKNFDERPVNQPAKARSQRNPRGGARKQTHWASKAPYSLEACAIATEVEWSRWAHV